MFSPNRDGSDHPTTPATAAGLMASQPELAHRLGVFHTAPRKAARSGRIAPEPGGGWDDAEKVRVRLAASSDPAHETGAAMAAPAPAARPRAASALPAAEPLVAPTPGGGDSSSRRPAEPLASVRTEGA